LKIVRCIGIGFGAVCRGMTILLMHSDTFHIDLLFGPKSGEGSCIEIPG